MSGWIADVLWNTQRAYSALPSASSLPGAIVAISDGKAANCADGACTTFGTAVTGGGGALALLLSSDGTNWRLIGANTTGGISINSTPVAGTTDKCVLFDKSGTISEDTGFKFDYTGRSLNAPAFNSIGVSNGGDTDSTLVGNLIGPISTSTFTTAIGRFIFGSSAGVTGTFNVGIGASALAKITSGGSNLGIGTGAIQSETTGSNNVAVGGGNALGSVNGGSNNVAIGASALTNIPSGSGNVAVGDNALAVSSTGFSFSVGIGHFALNASTGGQNVGIGTSAASAWGSGQNNTIVGPFAPASGVTSGSNNTLLGNWAGPAGSLNSVIALSDGAGNLEGDYNFTNSGSWTFTGTLNLTASAVAATVTANFTADHRLQVKFNGTTYYLPCSTTAW